MFVKDDFWPDELAKNDSVSSSTFSSSSSISTTRNAMKILCDSVANFVEKSFSLSTKNETALSCDLLAAAAQTGVDVVVDFVVFPLRGVFLIHLIRNRAKRKSAF